MNCCDYDCTQGRDCPARGARVAKVKQRMAAAEPLPRPQWRHTVGGACYMALAAIGALLCVSLIAIGGRL